MVRTLLICVFSIAAGLTIAFAMSRPNSAGEGAAPQKSKASQTARGSASPGSTAPGSSEPCVGCDFPSP